jgi:hypothetical protein
MTLEIPAVPVLISLDFNCRIKRICMGLGMGKRGVASRGMIALCEEHMIAFFVFQYTIA